MRRYREKLKKDPERYEEYKKKDLNRIKLKNKKITELSENEKVADKIRKMKAREEVMESALRSVYNKTKSQADKHYTFICLAFCFIKSVVNIVAVKKNKCKSYVAKLLGLGLRSAAYEYAEKHNIPHRFNKETKVAGKEWLRGFLQRHPDISLRQPTSTSIARAIGFNRPQVERFYLN
ncbi:hypothetical protein HF086_016730, partial [Spodoptera exigua]